MEHTTANLTKVIAKEKVFDSNNASYVRAPCKTKEEINNNNNTPENQIIKTIIYIPLIYLGLMFVLLIILIASGGPVAHL